MKKILITGVAGFIGFHLAEKLLKNNYLIVGIDNLNSYYDVNLKEERLKKLVDYSTFVFVKGDISNAKDVDNLFKTNNFEFVVNLAAQAGVRYSIDNPTAYIQSNIVGFFNILEACRHYKIEHLVFASSSSVYGSNIKVPYSTDDKVDCPVSLYAATKKSDELIGYSYAKLYGIPMTGLRFFTVYGPWGRPDMAYFKFTNKLVKGEPIQIYNNGDMFRDFTYIDDIVDGIIKVLNKQPKEDNNGAKYKIYNIGNNQPNSLMNFVNILEKNLINEHVIKQPGKKEFLPMQPGDVYQTYADLSDLIKDFKWRPTTSLDEGLKKFVEWYKEYYLKK
ncbi:MAG: GDP-mannose 4,6-dehydratase [Clostridia bacterium]|nr:GDP-mannose 4,6-dehydratase [Clostridia bacterium]